MSVNGRDSIDRFDNSVDTRAEASIPTLKRFDELDIHEQRDFIGIICTSYAPYYDCADLFWDHHNKDCDIDIISKEVDTLRVQNELPPKNSESRHPKDWTYLEKKTLRDEERIKHHERRLLKSSIANLNRTRTKRLRYSRLN